MMQYNILCTVKRFEAYETIGGLFTEVTNDTLELSVTDKIWAIILDFVLEAAERYSIDATELLADFIESNPVAHTLHNMYIYKQASWYIFTCESSVYILKDLEIWIPREVKEYELETFEMENVVLIW